MIAKRQSGDLNSSGYTKLIPDKEGIRPGNWFVMKFCTLDAFVVFDIRPLFVDENCASKCGDKQHDKCELFQGL